MAKHEAPNEGVNRAWAKLQKTKSRELKRKRDRDKDKPKYDPNAKY
jgi:hypothetical protein